MSDFDASCKRFIDALTKLKVSLKFADHIDLLYQFTQDERIVLKIRELASVSKSTDEKIQLFTTFLVGNVLLKHNVELVIDLKDESDKQMMTDFLYCLLALERTRNYLIHEIPLRHDFNKTLITISKLCSLLLLPISENDTNQGGADVLVPLLIWLMKLFRSDKTKSYVYKYVMSCAEAVKRIIDKNELGDQLQEIFGVQFTSYGALTGLDYSCTTLLIVKSYLKDEHTTDEDEAIVTAALCNQAVSKRREGIEEAQKCVDDLKAELDPKQWHLRLGRLKKTFPSCATSFAFSSATMVAR